MPQEFFSEDRWQWSKSALKSAGELLEETLSRQVKEIDEGPHLQDPQDYAEAFYYLVEEPGSVLRAGLFCQAVAAFEYTLRFLCMEAASVKGITAPDNTPRSIVSARMTFLKRVTEKDYLGRSEEIVVLTRLRNLILHSNGEEHGFPEERNAAIAAWIRRHPHLTTESSGAIRLTAGFFLHCLSVFDSLVQEIIVDLKRIELPPRKPRNLTA